jgi:hypothetical protein
MRTKLRLNNRLAAALSILSASWALTGTCADSPKASADQTNREPFITLTESHAQALEALRAERRKLKEGRSTVFLVLGAIKQLRDVEVQMSSTTEQLIAALARYSALLRYLEEEVSGTVTSGHIDEFQLRKCRQDADAVLESEKHKAAFHQKEAQVKAAKIAKRKLRRNGVAWPFDFTYPTLPPKVAML